jgi:hypothetical protein
LITLSANDSPTSDSEAYRRFYRWTAVEEPADPRDFVESEDISPYSFDTPAEAWADATQFLAEHRAVPDRISSRVA